jgi:hypothetical protein
LILWFLLLPYESVACQQALPAPISPWIVPPPHSDRDDDDNEDEDEELEVEVEEGDDSESNGASKSDDKSKSTSSSWGADKIAIHKPLLRLPPRVVQTQNNAPRRAVTSQHSPSVGTTMPSTTCTSLLPKPRHVGGYRKIFKNDPFLAT